MNIIQGDCLDKLKDLDDNSIDSCVTDPPYGLSFMGKKWDYDVPSVKVWKEIARVLKPGAFLLSFAGTRTYHRMAVNIEDAGFEIRDMIAWVYGSGFPKSHNIGKAVDKLQGNEREDLGEKVRLGDKKAYPKNASRPKEEYQGLATGNGMGRVTKGNSPWEGWGTALKPALEPICVARKPFKGTVAQNILKWGTGGINIDGCRVWTEDSLGRNNHVNPYGSSRTWSVSKTPPQDNTANPPQGRFPANFIHDGSDEVVELLNEASRFFYCAKASKSERNKGLEGFEEKGVTNRNTFKSADWNIDPRHPDGGYKVKHDTVHKNNHPTVKPIKLMQYLVKLVTPKDGTVLDPFMGSGTTGIACKIENFNFIGIEREKEYIKIAEVRISNWKVQDKLYA